MTGPTRAPVAELGQTASAGCTAALGANAGCVTTSETGQAGTAPPAGVAIAGCIATATADAGLDRPIPPQTVRELERALRVIGYSQRQAVSIAREGFRPAVPEPETDSAELNELREALQRNLAILKANHE